MSSVTQLGRAADRPVPYREGAVPDTSPTTRFAELVAVEPVPLDLAAALIGAHGDPGADADEVVVRLDALAADVAEPTLDGIVDWFRGAGFEGDRVTYGDPANSYLHRVLDRRLGIPITLSVVLIEVARRVGVDLAGVSMPGHFLVREQRPDGVLLDAFDGAARLDEPAAQLLYARLHGDGPGFHPSYLAPVSSLHVLTRILTNLRLAFTRTQDLAALTWVLRLRLAMPTVDAGERQALASVLATQGRYLDAAAELEQLAEVLDDEAEAQQRRHEARQLRAKLN